MTTPDEEITGYGGQPRSGPTTPGSGSESASQDFDHVAQDAKLKAKQAAEQVKTQGKEQLNSYRDTAADEIEKVAQGVKAAAAELEGQDQAGLSHYVSDMAQSMVKLADNLRGKSVDQLVGEVNRLARDNPALFITGSIALGFGLTRFARASARHSDDDHYGSSGATRFDSSSDDGLPSQRQLNEHIGAGETGGTIGSISNATGSSTTGTMGSTSGTSSSGTGQHEADTTAGLGMRSASGNDTSAGLATNASHEGKGKDGGLYP